MVKRKKVVSKGYAGLGIRNKGKVLKGKKLNTFNKRALKRGA